MNKLVTIILSVVFIVNHPLQASSESSCCKEKCHKKHRQKKHRMEADYVIVGVGTAGAVLAKKLTDDKKTSVIAIHSGRNLTENPQIKFTKNILTTVLTTLSGLRFSETGETTPQPNADNRELLWALALPEGGASSVNAGAYCRGTNELYAQWEKIAGKRWSVKRVLETFKELEHYYGKTNNPAARGHHGPLTVRQNPRPSKISTNFTQAIIEGTGFPFVLDYNDPITPIGASSALQYTQSPNGLLRVSSATAFLDEKVMTPDGLGVDGRKLRVLFKSAGLKALWEGNKAVGVEYFKNGQRNIAHAKKGVIVCGGLRSSSFLMHSGIGPGDLLNSLNIPVIFNNSNVGNGLADHYSVLLFYRTNPNDVSKHTSSVFEQIAWLPAPAGNQDVREIRIASVTLFPSLTVLFFDLIQPKSRGRITINSQNPLDPPVINEGILSNSSDLELLVQGLKTYIKNTNNALKEIAPEYTLLFPPEEILDNDALLRAFIKETINGEQHFQSHCRMAALNQGGVVDSTGLVYGTKNLYVADDSAAPLCMDGSPMASAYLIAANIARILIEEKGE